MGKGPSPPGGREDGPWLPNAVGLAVTTACGHESPPWGWSCASRGDATHQSVDRQVAPAAGCGVVEGDLQRVLGQNLRRIREQRGLSQEAFADVVGVHRTYLGGVERGERNLTLRSVERLAELVGVEALELLRAG